MENAPKKCKVLLKDAKFYKKPAKKPLREFIENNIPNINELHTDSQECCLQEWIVLL